MNTKLSPRAKALLWACDGSWMNADDITRALQTPYAEFNLNISDWPRSDQGLHQSASSLVHKGLLLKNWFDGVVHYRKVGS